MKVLVKTEESAAGPSEESKIETVDNKTGLSTIFKDPNFKVGRY